MMTTAQANWVDSVESALKVYEEQSCFGSFFRSNGSKEAFRDISSCVRFVREGKKTVVDLRDTVIRCEKSMGKKLSFYLKTCGASSKSYDQTVEMKRSRL